MKLELVNISSCTFLIRSRKLGLSGVTTPEIVTVTAVFVKVREYYTSLGQNVGHKVCALQWKY
jgi:hypothetical protein